MTLPLAWDTGGTHVVYSWSVQQMGCLANRLCDACKKFDSQVIISDAVAKRLSEEIKSDFEANFSIPGRTEKIGIHKLQL